MEVYRVKPKTMFTLCGCMSFRKDFFLRIDFVSTLDVTQIKIIPLRSKKRSGTNSECISQKVNNMKRNEEAGKLIATQ